VRFDVFADTLRVASGLEANVHGLDWDRRVVGAVDRFDRAKWLEALERGNIGDCGDFNGDGFETIGDTLILAAHMGHHRPRKVISPDGGEVWPVGTVHVTTWIPGAGDSAYVSLYLHRDLSPSFSVRVAVDVPDTGAFAWTIDSALANAPDYRIQAVHTAGLFDSVSTNSVGSDESDLPFTISGSTVSVAPGHDATWLSFGLDRGRPNPSRGPMSISFALPSGGHAQLQAFDLQGRLVRTLSDADYAAGRWTVEWDCRDRSGRPVRAGIYIIRLRAGGRYAEHKALVLR